MNLKSVVWFLAALGLSGAAFYFSFKNIPFDDFLEYVAAIDYRWAIPSVVAIVAAFLLRVVRWRIILNAGARVSFMGAYHPLMIAFMANGVLPGRIGELLRPAVLARREPVRYSTGLATVAVERFFDALVIGGLFIAVLTTINIDPDTRIRFGDFVLEGRTLSALGRNMLFIAGALMGVATLMATGWFRSLLIGGAERLPDLFFTAGEGFRDKVRQKVARPVAAAIRNLSEGFNLLRRPWRVAACAGLTLGIWAFQAASYYILQFGAPGVAISFWQMTAVMTIISLFIALPSVPGYWGIWEAAGVFAMTLFGVARSEAAGFTLVNHVIQFLPVMIAGMVSAWIIGVNILTVRRSETDAPQTGSS